MIVAGFGTGETLKREGPKEVYLASFFPKAAPFSCPGIGNRLSRKRAERKADALNRENYAVFQRKAAPVISLVKTMDTRTDRSRKVLVYWQLGELISSEKDAHRNNGEYHALFIQSLSRDSGLDLKTIRDIEQFYVKYKVAASLSLQLNWEHYSVLIAIDDNGERTLFQNRAVEKKWTPDELRSAVQENGRKKSGDGQ